MVTAVVTSLYPAQLVLRWVTIHGYATLVCNQPLGSTQPPILSRMECECCCNFVARQRWQCFINVFINLATYLLRRLTISFVTSIEASRTRRWSLIMRCSILLLMFSAILVHRKSASTFITYWRESNTWIQNSLACHASPQSNIQIVHTFGREDLAKKKQSTYPPILQQYNTIQIYTAPKVACES